jgi:hypothetical protein
MLINDERMCEFGICLLRLLICSHFDYFVNFGCHTQASQLLEPA